MKVKNIILGFLVVFISIVSILGIAFEVRYWKKVYPGINVAGVNVGGLNLTEATNKITEKADTVKSVVLKWGVNEWILEFNNIGLKYEPTASVIEAIQLGRSGNLVDDFNLKWKAGRFGLAINPMWTWDEESLQTAIASVAGQIDIPAQEPEIIRVAGNKLAVTVTPGENGQQVNRDALKAKLKAAVTSWGKIKIDIPVMELKPKLTDEQVNLVKSKATALLGKKLLIQETDTAQNWTVGDDQLLTWLDLQTGEWKRLLVREWVQELAKTVDREPQNATFRFLGQGKVEEFNPAKNGVTVLEESTTDGIISALDKLNGEVLEQTTDLVTRETKPEVSTEDVNSLGIKELIGKGESWYKGSITNRIFNLKKAASIISGYLVPPGELFSFNKAVGEVSQNTGFKQAYIIKEGKTVLGDGGGVCQVSTTLFRAVLAAGLPIEQRTAHAYRVSYYEVNYQPGFDATVFQPSPDFIFRNDTNAYILIQAVYDEKAQYLAFELYGTSDGRKAEVSKARIWEVVPPPPDLYQDDPTMPVGRIVQTEHSAWGAKVAFDWKVTRGDEVLQQKTFYSNYKPWQAVYLKGTKIN